MTTRAYGEWSKRLDAGTLTLSQVRQFAAAISTAANGDDVRGRRSNLTGDERSSLFARVKAHPVRLTDEHNAQALAWFKRYASAAQSAGGLGMATYERDLVLEHFRYFTFNGEYVTSGRYVWPVWTLHLSGRVMRHVAYDRLQYYAVPWQARTDEVYSDFWRGTERG